MIAFDGDSYLFNPSAGVTKAPFLPGVFKAFGFSYDSRNFLYLKSNGRLPSFALYRYNLIERSERFIANGVHHAVWSPASLKIAYISLDEEARFELRVHDPASGASETVFTGPLSTDYLEWSEDGNQLRYVSVVTATDTAFEDQTYAYQLREYDVYARTNSLPLDGAVSPPAQARSAPERLRSRRGLVTSGEGHMRNFISSGRRAFATVVESGAPMAKRLDAATGAWTAVAPGDVYAATEEGVVVRRFRADGVQYQYIEDGAEEPSENFAGDLTFKLPFQGSAYLVQGGDAYTSGAVCDGRRCLVIAHKNALAAALDWQQTTEEGQGNQHMLAIADGTVVAIANNITCNSVNTACLVGYDDYAKPCPSNDGAGNYVVLAHSDGSYSLYAHLKSGSVQVAANKTVLQGAYLADQGHSGSANSPTKYRNCGDHLHFQRQTSPALWGPSVPTDFTETSCVLSCLSAYVSDNVELGAPPAQQLSITLSPQTVVGSLTTKANTVALPSAAPSGGAVVTLASSDATRASVPASVTIPAGGKSTTFSIAVNGDSSASIPVTISASRGGSTATAVLTVSPPEMVAVALASSVVGGGNPLPGNEVTLSGASGGSFQVALTSSKPAVAQVPASVQIASGKNAGQFEITTSTVTAETSVTIQAAGGGMTKSSTLTVQPFNLSSLTLSPSAVFGGVSTAANLVTLSSIAPASATMVTLSSANTSIAKTPASVSVPAGAKESPPFTITTSAVTAPVTVNITAKLGSVSKVQALTVNPAAPALAINAPASNAVVLGSVDVTGWALDNTYGIGSAIARVEVFVDGAKVGEAQYGSARADICTQYPGRPGCPNVGWAYKWNTAGHANGAHTLRVCATDSDATPRQTCAQQTAWVNNPVNGLPPFLWPDLPPRDTFVSGTVGLQGWAVDNITAIETPIAAVEVFVDNVKVGNAQYGAARPDVCALVPNRLGCPNVGYAYQWNTSSLSNGVHQLRVCATDSDITPKQTCVEYPVQVSKPVNGLAPTAWLDLPPRDSTVSGVVDVFGWALDNAAAVESPIAAVDIFVDSTKVGTAQYGLPRPDVCALLPNRLGCPDVGWAYKWNTYAASNGAHLLRACATDSDITPKQNCFEQPVRVSNSSGPPFLWIDLPPLNAPGVSGTTEVYGWAVDNLSAPETAIKLVEIFLDNVKIGNAQYGVPRPDVCALVPGRPGCPNVGYSYQWNTGNVTKGAHTLKVCVTDSDATPKQVCADRPVQVN
ncbi:MAG: peptidoglycan DD-metalloendopeptidase family protein [Bryobacteraceae bacterium]|nr:peptidoglycan DD-metalloendopeptidase family protein [Bryobacteraceae bacterium]